MSNKAFLYMSKWLEDFYVSRQKLDADLAPLKELEAMQCAVADAELFGLMSDKAIRDHKELLISPFVDTGGCLPGAISYGLTSFGYDLRVGTKFKVFTNARCKVVDPKAFDEQSFIDVDAPYCLIPPNSFALAESVETIKMPRNVLGLCIGKSTYARCGVVIPMTPLEPEWRGKVTIEISNTTPLPAKIYASEGICQVLFLKSPFEVGTSYNDTRGKYQDQEGLTLPR
jgi:dCTP deaminase